MVPYLILSFSYLATSFGSALHKSGSPLIASLLITASSSSHKSEKHEITRSADLGEWIKQPTFVIPSHSRFNSIIQGRIRDVTNKFQT